MTLIDKAEAHDDDLIRRGDALAAVQLGDTVTKMQARIRAIPYVDADPVCTGCGGTGITYQTERRCACQPALPARGVGVRPLVWEAREDIAGLHNAQSAIGWWYNIHELSDGRFRYDGDPALGTDVLPQAFPTLDAAKAAAQRDFEARILAALEPADPPEEIGVLRARVEDQTATIAALRRELAMGRAAPTDAAQTPFRIEDMTLADLMRDPLYEAATAPASDAAQAREAALREAAEMLSREGFEYAPKAILALIGETRA